MESDQCSLSPSLSNAWENDNLSLSSEFEVDMIAIEEGEAQYEPRVNIHKDCISKQEFEREKEKWESEMNSLAQRFERTSSMLESMKAIILEDQKQVERLEKEKNEALAYRETFEKLQEQIVTLNNMLYESNNETEKYKNKVTELKETVEELEDKLYGPTNYYYKLYLECQDEIEQMKIEKDTAIDQLRQVKDILRNMIIDKSKAPTEDDLIRERQSFAREIAVYEKRINKLQEENDRLRKVVYPCFHEQTKSISAHEIKHNTSNNKCILVFPEIGIK